MTEETKEYAMDKAHSRLLEMITVLRFVHKYWKVLPEPNVILDIVIQELANIASPGAAWKMIAKLRNGIHLPDDQVARDETDYSGLVSDEKP